MPAVVAVVAVSAVPPDPAPVCGNAGLTRSAPKSRVPGVGKGRLLRGPLCRHQPRCGRWIYVGEGISHPWMKGLYAASNGKRTGKSDRLLFARHPDDGILHKNAGSSTESLHARAL